MDSGQDIDNVIKDSNERAEELMRVYSHTILRIKDAGATLNMVTRHIVSFIFVFSGIDLVLFYILTNDLVSLVVGTLFVIWGIYRLYRSINSYHDDIKDNGVKYGLVYSTGDAH